MGLIKTFTTRKDKNLAYHTGDDKNNVDKARLQLSRKLGYESKKLKYMNQVHGSDVKIVEDETNLYECDALVTNKKNTPLMVMVADCIPILFFEEKQGVIAAVHAGRNGVFLDIASKTAECMKENFGCKSEDIKAVLGPSIQKCCYEVSQELADIAQKSFSKKFVNGRYLDLQGIVKMQLLNAGIKQQNLEISKICTKCGGEDYFSYRNDKSCGRFAGIIMLTD